MLAAIVDRTPTPYLPPHEAHRALQALGALPEHRQPTCEELQARVNSFLRAGGSTNSQVTLEVSNDANAYALGFCWNGFACGKICIGSELISFLTPAEVDFVLAHEVIHILENHLQDRMLLGALHSMVELAMSGDAGGRLLLRGWDLFKIYSLVIGDPAPSEALTKEQELQADAGAVRLTGKKGPAVTALTRLVGGDLNAPSHLWEVLRIHLPIMSMRERLAALDQTFPGWP